MSNIDREKEHMLNGVKKEYGDRLSEEQMEAVEASLSAVVKVLEQLRSVPLLNSDEPFSVFKPYRSEEG